MYLKHWAALFCKVLAIYILVGCIKYLSVIVAMPVSAMGVELWQMIILGLSYLAPFVLELALAWFLWARAGYLSEKMAGSEVGISEENQADMEALQVMVFSAAGVLVLSDALPDLVRQLYSLIVMQHIKFSGAGWNHVSTIANTAGAVVKLAMGLWLLLGSRGIVRLLGYLRKVGVAKNEPENG